MAAASALCAVSETQEKASRPAPCFVHVRFDRFLVASSAGARPQFRMRLQPVPIADLGALLGAFTPAVDQDSNCGFYLNFFASPFLQHDFSGTLRRLQLEVRKNTGVLVSVGAANSKIAAAVASRIALPGELRLIEPGSEAEFVANLPVEVMHAMDGIDASDLRRHGVNTVAELRRVPRPVLVSVYREIIGSRIWRNSRALDSLPAIQNSPSAVSRGWLRSAAEAFVAAL